jgi:hypothetical protein
MLNDCSRRGRETALISIQQSAFSIPKKRAVAIIDDCPAVVAGDPAPQQLTAPCRKYSGRLHPPSEQVMYRSISF